MDAPRALAEITKLSNLEDELEPESVLQIKANLIGEITRAISSRFTTLHTSTAGITRRIRWKTNGLEAPTIADGDDDAGDEQDQPQNLVKDFATLEYHTSLPLTKTTVKQLGRRVYADVKNCRLTSFPFVESGISTFYPMRRGSWVAVVIKQQVHVGQGEFARYC
jgi:hypothetical protein